MFPWNSKDLSPLNVHKRLFHSAVLLSVPSQRLGLPRPTPPLPSLEVPEANIEGKVSRAGREPGCSFSGSRPSSCLLSEQKSRQQPQALAKHSMEYNLHHRPPS